MILKAVHMATLSKEPLESKNFRAGGKLKAHLIEYLYIIDEKTEAQRSWVICPCHGCIANQ